MQIILINVIKGILLIVLFWLVNTFIAFVPFNRKSNTRIIIITWIITDLLIYFYLKKINQINSQVNISALAFVILLTFLYFIPVSSKLPRQAITLNKKISKKHKNKYKYAKELFSIIEKKWTSPTRQYLLQPHKSFFIKSSKYFWKKGYVPCNIQAEIYRNMLIQSKRFKKNEVLLRITWCANSPHTYVEIKHPKKIIYADLWAKDHFKDYKFGQASRIFCERLKGKEFKIR